MFFFFFTLVIIIAVHFPFHVYNLSSNTLLTVFLYMLVSVQIDEEFFRITNKNLLGTFRDAVERYTPKPNILKKLDNEV